MQLWDIDLQLKKRYKEKKNMTKNMIIALISIAIIFIAILIARTSDIPKQTPGQNPGKTVTNLPTQTQSQELKVEDITVGTGPEVKNGDTVVIHYKGTLTNGKQFDSSYDRGQPFETKIGVGQVIKGWDQGVAGMKIGGKRKLIIPSELGYGAAGAPPAIPANATLVFEVELLKVE